MLPANDIMRIGPKRASISEPSMRIEARRRRPKQEIKAAIGLDPRFIPAYVNLADLYRARGRDAEGERILRDGLKIAPNSAMLHHGARPGAGADEAHRRRARRVRARDDA